MRHRVAGKRLGRTTSHRRAMRRNMAAALFHHGAIRTTEAKAKEIRRFVEKLITVARQGSLHARRRVLAELGDRSLPADEGKFLEKTVVQKLFDEIAPSYLGRPGGYTRIVRLDERRIGDAGVQVILQLISAGEEAPPAGSEAGASRRRRRAVKRHKAAGSVSEVEAEGRTATAAPLPSGPRRPRRSKAPSARAARATATAALPRAPAPAASTTAAPPT